MKKRESETIIMVARYILIGFIFWLLFGCGSLSKDKQKSTEKTKTESRVNLSKELKEVSNKISNISSAQQVIQFSDFVEVEVLPGQDLVIQKTNESGETSSIKLTGAGKVKLSSTTAQTTNNSIEHSEDNSSKEQKIDSTGANKSSGFKKGTSVKTERSGSFWWLWVVIMLLVLAWYVNKKYNWVNRLKNGVTSAIKSISKFSGHES